VAKAGKKHSTSDKPSHGLGARRSEALRGLGRLTYILKKAAADHASNESLTVDERLLLAWQSRVLAAAARKLIAEPALPYEQRVLAVWEAISAACLLTPSMLNDRVQKKLQTALATQAKKRADLIIRQVLEVEDTELSHWPDTWPAHERLAKIIHGAVNEQLAELNPPHPPLSVNAIRLRLWKLYPPAPAPAEAVRSTIEQ
jgi:hypothetical protein